MNFKQFSAGRIVDAYRSGCLSPVAVAQWAITAYEATEADTQAWVNFDAQQLMDGAKAAEQALQQGATPRALEAIPVGVKDIFNTARFPTQMGSPLWGGFTPGNDARVLYDLQRHGGLIPGKTVTAEFAVHTLGKTRNPYAPDRTPGTSSSGSAVAVATGVVPVALGTQTAGSIIRPASFCGVWGCKPSFGLIPRTGMLKTTDSLDTVGYFVGHAEDLPRVFDVLRVHGRDYPVSNKALSDLQRQAAPVGRPWRIAVARPAVWAHAPAYAVQAIDAWCQRLAGDPRFELVDAPLPAEFAYTNEAHDVHATIYNRALAYYFKEEHQRAELVSPVMSELIEAGLQISAQQYEAALNRQVELARLMDARCANVDVMVTLSTAGIAPPRHQEELPDSSLIWTLTHLPAISAPAFTSPDGLPFGLQLVARRYNDPLLMRCVAELVEHGLLPAHSYGAAARQRVAAIEASGLAVTSMPSGPLAALRG